jgi:hypothetical protein
MKKKKIIIILFLLFFLGWGSFKVFNLRTEKVIEVDNDSKFTNTDSKNPTSLKLNSEIQKSEGKSIYRNENRGDEEFHVFDEIEKSWLLEMKEIIGSEYFVQYIDLKKNNDEEKMKAYKEHHDYLRQKYGNKFSYNISDDQSEKEKKINQRYLKNLLKIIGPAKFKMYTSAKDQFNEELRRKNKEAIQMEF